MADDGGLSRRRALTIGGAAAATLGFGSLSNNDSEEPPPAIVRDRNSPFTRLHQAGITAAGVRVGILDTTGFDPGHAAIEDAVTELQGFDGSSLVVDSTSHGTAAAATVATLAPDVELLLAAFERPGGFAAALGWFQSQQADIVLAPVAAHGSVGLESPVVESATTATKAGLPIIAPTGNVAQGHWESPLGSLVTKDGDAGRELQVRPLPGHETVAGKLVAWLGGDAETRTDLTLALLERTRDANPRNLIALSQPRQWSEADRLVADLEPGRYVLEVRRSGHTAVPSSLAREAVTVATPTHRLEPARPAGSIAAPASAPGVLAVGAMGEDRVAPYSGRGPTADKREGVDLVLEPSPWFGHGEPGTSGAAARAAGTAALVAAVDPPSSPNELWAVLEAASAELEGVSPLVAGAGLLDPVAAVQYARANR